MKKIYFKNSCDWNHVYAVVDGKRALLSNNEDGYYFAFFDSQNHEHVYFEDGCGNRTGRVYPGALSIGVDYKYSENMDRELIYLYSINPEKTGRVYNYLLEDATNLTHRDDKSKKISVFVPSSYDGVTPCDILYFFDAQNLFDKAGHYTENGDPYGSWQLDVVLDEIHRQYGKNIIVVGIDNADKYRDHELFMDPSRFGALAPLATALPDEDYSKGYLDNLADFMIHTLHPFIKDRYCISEENIGIGGASMGGIASFYCGLREMGFYKYVLSYSPAYGLYEMSAFDNYFKSLNLPQNAQKLPRIHIYCGGGDPLEQMLLPSSKAMKSALVERGYPENYIFETFDAEKPHNEESWRLILPHSFKLVL